MWFKFCLIFCTCLNSTQQNLSVFCCFLCRCSDRQQLRGCCIRLNQIIAHVNLIKDAKRKKLILYMIIESSLLSSSSREHRCDDFIMMRPEAWRPTWLVWASVFTLPPSAKLQQPPAAVWKDAATSQRLRSWTQQVDELIAVRPPGCYHRRKSTWLLWRGRRSKHCSLIVGSDLRIFMASLCLRICGSIRCVRIFCTAVAMRHNTVTLPGVCLQPRLIVLVCWRADGGTDCEWQQTCHIHLYSPCDLIYHYYFILNVQVNLFNHQSEPAKIFHFQKIKEANLHF